MLFILGKYAFYKTFQTSFVKEYTKVLRYAKARQEKYCQFTVFAIVLLVGYVIDFRYNPTFLGIIIKSLSYLYGCEYVKNIHAFK